MSFLSTLAAKFGGLLGAAAIRAWMKTLDNQAAFYDRTVDPADEECDTPAIYVFWHENILFPIYLRGHNHLVMLVSQHRDAEILSRAGMHLGFDFVRGSTYGGALSAVRELLRRGERMHVAITPDGPRGPRRELAQGPIYLSSKLGLPLVLLGVGYDRPWRMNSWDRFAIPRPFSRARAVVSERIQIPPGLERSGIEHYRLRMQGLLDRLSLEAEAWAASDSGKRGQVAVRRQPGPPHPNRGKTQFAGATLIPTPRRAAG